LMNPRSLNATDLFVGLIDKISVELSY